MWQKQVILLLLATILPLSCRDNAVDPGRISSIEFPLSVGSEWFYATFDSVTGKAGTLQISIIAERKSLSGQQLTFWEFRTDIRTDTTEGILNGDTLRLLLVGTAPAPPLVIILPLSVYSYWKSSLDDSVAVLYTQRLTVPAGTFQGAYFVHQEAVAPNDFSQYDYSVMPGVGIVRHQRRIRFATEGRNRANVVWELTFYLLR
jgi:hypothetical protein